MLNAHIMQHIKCSLCDYSASKRLVKLHEMDEHGLGEQQQSTDEKVIKPFLKTMDTPEEIEKWRAERRRNYPTEENIQAKSVATNKRGNNKRKLQEILNTFRIPNKPIRKDSSKEPIVKNDVDQDKEQSNNNSDDDGEPEECGTSLQLHDRRSGIPCKYKNRCKKGDSCPYKHVVNSKPNPNPKKEQKSKMTLFDKLRASDAKEERELVYDVLDWLVAHNRL